MSTVGASEAAGDAPAAGGPTVEERTGWFAAVVAAGIFLSRIFGLVRQRVFAHYLGDSDAADAFIAAFRIPNALQNLFGEGVLSASFIPVYAGMRARGETDEARAVAGAVASMLGLVVAVLVLLGVLAAPLLVSVIAVGFEGEKRELTILLVRILFPGAGLLVLSAWSLGILNSHRRFFLPYVAPVLWNLAIIGALVVYGPRLAQPRLAIVVAWGAVIGSALQLGVQLPAALRLARGVRLSLGRRLEGARTVVRNFFPVFVARGVVQISAFVDEVLATLLPAGAVSWLFYAQMLYMLPVSLFGMAVSAAELPAMSSTRGETAEVAAALRRRIDAGLARIAFFVVPSAAAFVFIGDALVAVIYRTGRFDEAAAFWVWTVLGGASIGLLATTMARLYSSAFYALGDTRTPFRIAVVRVALTIALGVAFALVLPPLLGIDPRWGAAGLSASAGIAGWLELLLLRRALRRRVGSTGLGAARVGKLWVAALLGASVAMAAKGAGAAELGPLRGGTLIILAFGIGYLAAAAALRIPELRTLTSRLRRR